MMILTPCTCAVCLAGEEVDDAVVETVLAALHVNSRAGKSDYCVDVGEVLVLEFDVDLGISGKKKKDVAGGEW